MTTNTRRLDIRRHEVFALEDANGSFKNKMKEVVKDADQTYYILILQ